MKLNLRAESSSGIFYREAYGESDYSIIAEVYRNDCYGIRQMALEGFSPHTIIDVGAQIGSFSVLAHHVWPSAQIIAIEVDPGHYEALHQNLDSFATVVEAAVSYEPGPLRLYSTLHDKCVNSGGSFVGPPDLDYSTWENGFEYLPAGVVRKISLEEIYPPTWERVDLLKIDAEGKGPFGTEWSILNHANLARINRIVGEYHGETRQGDQPGEDKFRDLLANPKFASWEVSIRRGGDLGLFEMQNKTNR
jgi:FkbM family methyltransferase